MRAIPCLLAALLTLSGCTAGWQSESGFSEAHSLVGGDARKGKAAMGRYGCGACHTIPGIRDATGLVGPPLARMAVRTYIAGVLPNTPENIQRWIADPPGVDAQTAMPKLGVSGADLQDIATYLYTLR